MSPETSFGHEHAGKIPPSVLGITLGEQHRGSTGHEKTTDGEAQRALARKQALDAIASKEREIFAKMSITMEMRLDLTRIVREFAIEISKLSASGDEFVSALERAKKNAVARMEAVHFDRMAFLDE
ncbi:MAG: hypothetical protein WCO25_02935 [Candidatus Uhrbacteria bacterium]